MIHRSNFLVVLLVCFCFGPINAKTMNSTDTEPKNTRQVQHAIPGTIYGKVTDIIDTGGYTYAEVDTGKETVWAAAPASPLKIGDMIAFTTQMPMKNFRSKSIKRDFPVVYFTDRFMIDKNTPAMTSPHDKMKKQPAAKPVEGINKAKDGNTIAEIYADKNNLNGKSIRVRGQVTKFTANILGKNWLHIRDSSTLNDLTVTTDGSVVIDDVVIIEGKLELNKNYGYGYVYPLIVVDARTTKE